MIIKDSTLFYLLTHTRAYAMYDGSTWAVTDTVAMRLPSDYVLGDQHMCSDKFIHQLLESSGFYNSSNLIEVDVESWRAGLVWMENTDLPFNDVYNYQSELVRLFPWRLTKFKVSLSSGFLYLFDIYTGDLCGIILPVKKKKVKE